MDYKLLCMELYELVIKCNLKKLLLLLYTFIRTLTMFSITTVPFTHCNTNLTSDLESGYRKTYLGQVSTCNSTCK